MNNNWNDFYKAYKNVFCGFILFIIGIAVLIIFRNLQTSIPKGEMFKRFYSPDRTYILDCYRYSDKDWNLYVESYNALTYSSKVIYNVYHEDDVVIEWKDNETAIINGNEVNVKNGYFEKLKGATK